MTQPTAAQGKLVDKSNNPQIQDRQPAILALTDSTGGTANDTVGNLPGTVYADDHATIENNFAEFASKLNEIIESLEKHGLIEDNGTGDAVISLPPDTAVFDQTGSFATCWAGISVAASGYFFYYNDDLSATSLGAWVTPTGSSDDYWIKYEVISEDTVWGVDREGDIDSVWKSGSFGLACRIKDTVVAGTKFCTIRVDIATSADEADIVAQQTYTLTADKQ